MTASVSTKLDSNVCLPFTQAPVVASRGSSRYLQQVPWHTNTVADNMDLVELFSNDLTFLVARIYFLTPANTL